jgi:trehalose 6-phosphate synthase
MSDEPSIRTAPLIVASNRGPITFQRGPGGAPVAERGTGGLVTALTGALEASKGLWVAAAMSKGDRDLAASSPGPIDLRGEGIDYRLRFVEIPPRVYDRYYNWIANGLLWFVHHYLWDTVRKPNFSEDVQTAWDDYVDVNRTFSDALAAEGARRGVSPVYLVQDYHLSLVPRLLRDREPQALIAHFSHTPFAGSTYLRILPARIRESLLRGMLGADVLGFHSQDWANNFLMSVRSVPGARVDLARSRVSYEGREILVRTHPVSVDVAPMRHLAASEAVATLRRELLAWRGDAKLILRVDRLELTKNIARGFTAYEYLLAHNPDHRGRVKFLALLSPSRQEMPEYRTYTDECLAEAERVNRRFGTPSWTPIEVRVRDDYPGAIAAYGVYDVLLVNPIIDGMNLVAMEGPLVNRHRGALALSRNAGAYGRLGRYALGLNPFDIIETANAIEEALTMPEYERARRARGLARLVLANPPERWIGDQLRDLERIRRRRSARAS